MDEIYEQWRNDLIAAGKLRPDEELSIEELSIRWQQWQVEQLKSGNLGSFASLDAAEALGLKTVEKEETKEINIREGIKQALNALLTKAQGANYCMIVVSKAWINFRYKRSKDNLHLQVAGNKYIVPMKLESSDITRLEAMSIHPEPMSVEIYACDFDSSSRNLDRLVDLAFEIFNEVYHVSDNAEAYVELDLGKGESEEVMRDIAQFFSSHSRKKFSWNWNRTL